MDIRLEHTKDTLKLYKFIKFCNIHFIDDYHLGGSLCEYFYIENFSLDNVNDYDVVINKTYKDYLSSLPEVSEWKYQGDLRYIGETENFQNVYKSKLVLKNDVYIVDWIFGNTVKLLHDTVNVKYQGIKTKLNSKKLRVEILKKIATNKNQKEFFINKAKLRLNSYINKTLL